MGPPANRKVERLLLEKVRREEEEEESFLVDGKRKVQLKGSEIGTLMGEKLTLWRWSNQPERPTFRTEPLQSRICLIPKVKVE